MVNPSIGSVRLSDLLKMLPREQIVRQPPGDLKDIFVTQIQSDSRSVKPGDLFIAHVGGSLDGHHYIPDAIQRGAVAVLGTAMLEDISVPYLQVGDSRLALAYLAAAFYGLPARKLTMIGVTGTDGKTTTCNLIYHILKSAGVQVGMISTVNAIIGGQVFDTGFHVTTPDSADIQHYLHQMVAAGMSHAVLETTSHGLAQHRVTACDFDIAVVTNITHEHLDYHGSYESYREAKAGLFKSLGNTPAKPHVRQRLAVLNRDDSAYKYLSSTIDSITTESSSPVKVVSYGLDKQADLRAEHVKLLKDGLEFEAVGTGLRAPIRSGLIGAYNVSNCLAATAAVIYGLGLSIEEARDGIAATSGIPGRMERLELGLDFLTFVDFAHTPYALERVLETARQITSSGGRQGRVIAVFGSAGLRDRLKRRMMAEASIRLADVSIFTAEDPRSESLEAILAEMAAGAEARGGIEGKDFWRVPDRGDAIRFALSLARPGDAVLALGKGHEQSMCFGEIEYAWDDRLAMRAAAAEILGTPGPAMPLLPTSKPA